MMKLLSIGLIIVLAISSGCTGDDQTVTQTAAPQEDTAANDTPRADAPHLRTGGATPTPALNSTNG